MSPLLILFILTLASKIRTEDEFCEADKCVNYKRVEDWLDKVKDPARVIESDGNNGEVDAKPLYELASCDEKEAIWNYKYTGSKGKRKMFKGKGKLSFVKVSDPPHGYDYGMKSGICLIKNNKEVKSIDGEFNQKGQLDGNAKVDFFNGTRIIGAFKMGVQNGLGRVFVDTVDEETNIPKAEKVLDSVQHVSNGVAKGCKWTIRTDDLQYFQSDESDHEVTLFVPHENKTFEVYKGVLDKDDMLIKASKAEIKSLKIENGMLTIEVTKEGEEFDYDLQMRAKTNAKVAKMIRFFEYVTVETNSLTSKFADLEEPVKIGAQLIVSKQKKITDTIYEMNCPYDPSGVCYGTFEGLKDFDSDGEIRMVSKLTYKTLIDQGNANETLLALMNITDDLLHEYLPLDNVYYLLPSDTIKSIKGNFKEGKLEGPVEFKFLDGSTFEGRAKEGALHGIARLLNPYRSLRLRNRYISSQKIKFEGVNYKTEAKVREVTHCGIYKNGYVQGPLWNFLHGGSFLFGNMDGFITSMKNFTTKNGAYINKDKKGGYFGEFFEGKMVKGQLAAIEDLIQVNEIVVPLPGDKDGKVFKDCLSNLEDCSRLIDPIEEKYVYVNQSLFLPKEQGLYAKIDIPKDTIFAFFGGHLYTLMEWNQTTYFDPKYVAKFVEGHKEYFVYLPDEIGNDLNKYRATMGHKINHKFMGNCFFVPVSHPRFGLIPGARAFNNINQGDEILCNYNFKFHEGQPWYQELWRVQYDFDNPEGQFGHRERKRPKGLPISPMLCESELYKEFVNFATNELKLDPLT